MKRILALAAAILLVLSLSLAAYADNTVLKTTVPANHSISLEIYGMGSVLVNGAEYKSSALITLPRHWPLHISIKEESLGNVQYAQYISRSASGNIPAGKVYLPSVSEDGTFRVFFGRTGVHAALTADGGNTQLWFCLTLSTALFSVLTALALKKCIQ